ncbi:hypothetical protein V8G54_036680 [Vigna mungo]|uniref:Uncharacterized protein n=1 Tax=Vigna mungo TaxID=3915 RepID=A0AAQ3REP8_VIGMU
MEDLARLCVTPSDTSQSSRREMQHKVFRWNRKIVSGEALWAAPESDAETVHSVGGGGVAEMEDERVEENMKVEEIEKENEKGVVWRWVITVEDSAIETNLQTYGMHEELGDHNTDEGLPLGGEDETVILLWDEDRKSLKRFQQLAAEIDGLEVDAASIVGRKLRGGRELMEEVTLTNLRQCKEKNVTPRNVDLPPRVQPYAKCDALLESLFYHV